MGADATITIDRSSTMETTCETAKGITLSSGYISPYMIANPERMETVLEKPWILFTDYRLTEATDIMPIMEKMIAAKKTELVVICDNMEQAALATAVINKIKGVFFVVAVAMPGHENKKVTLEDMALMTGGRVFTESKGDKLDEATPADLGRATRFICRRGESVIVGPRGKKEVVKEAIEQLHELARNEIDEKKKREHLQRLAFMTNSVAVIKVGAMTDNEQRALKYKVEDAVNAVKAAYKGGVVCGAGLSLARLKTSSPILNAALKQPSIQLRQNMGLEYDAEEMLADEAVNVVTGEKGKFMDIGVMDPVDVLIAGIESSVSIASVLVTSSGIITETAKTPPVVRQ
jgi:chaperonin GroEL